MDEIEDSVGSTIEKIKRLEQNKEAKLKAKREYEATISALERSIRDAMLQIKKFDQEILEVLKKTHELEAQLTIQKIRRDVLYAQLRASSAELEHLKTKLDLHVSEVREIRATYCKAVQDMTDKYDVWALLMKPGLPEAIHRPAKKTLENNEYSLVNEGRLKSAVERREKALAERERLITDPEAGEEFVRLRNALRYSLEMIASLKKENVTDTIPIQ